MNANNILQRHDLTPEEVRFTPEQLLSDYQALGTPREIDAVLRLVNSMSDYTDFCNDQVTRHEFELGESRAQCNRLKRANGDLRTELEGTHEANSILRAAVQQLANEIADNGAEPLPQPIAPGFVPFGPAADYTEDFPITFTATDQNGKTHWYELIL